MNNLLQEENEQLKNEVNILKGNNIYLTVKQKKLYDFIKSYIKKNGFAPTYVEMKEYLNLKSISTIYYYLERIEKRVWIAKRIKGSIRNIVPVSGIK